MNGLVAALLARTLAAASPIEDELVLITPVGLDQAKKNALALSCGHCFIIFMSSGFPINILNTIKAVREVCAIYCATGNPVEVIAAESDIADRKQMLRKFGYKL